MKNRLSQNVDLIWESSSRKQSCQFQLLEQFSDASKQIWGDFPRDLLVVLRRSVAVQGGILPSWKQNLSKFSHWTCMWDTRHSTRRRITEWGNSPLAAWRGGIKVTDKIRITHPLMLRWEAMLELSAGLMLSTLYLWVGKEKGVESKICRCYAAGMKLRKKTISQKGRRQPEAWEGWSTGSAQPPQGNQPCQCLVLAQENFWPPEL
jgi:hypothetical protein